MVNAYDLRAYFEFTKKGKFKTNLLGKINNNRLYLHPHWRNAF